MDAQTIYGDLKRICRALDVNGNHAIAAHVSLCMAMLQEKYDLDIEDSGEASSQDHSSRLKA